MIKVEILKSMSLFAVAWQLRALFDYPLGSGANILLLVGIASGSFAFIVFTTYSGKYS